jgi:hypothetical protein
MKRIPISWTTKASRGVEKVPTSVSKSSWNMEEADGNGNQSLKNFLSIHGCSVPSQTGMNPRATGIPIMIK